MNGSFLPFILILILYEEELEYIFKRRTMMVKLYKFSLMKYIYFLVELRALPHNQLDGKQNEWVSTFTYDDYNTCKDKQFY